MCVVKLLDVLKVQIIKGQLHFHVSLCANLKCSLVLVRDKVDCHSLTTKSTTATDSVDVVLSVGGEIVVDDQRHLLHIDSSGQEIGGDQDSRGSGPEFSHDDVTLLLVHVSVHGGHSEIPLVHLLSQPVDLT